MTPGSELQKDLRRYLLGQLDDQTAEAFEKEFLLKDEIFDELLAAEDELIEDYLAEILTVEDRRALENHFLSTPDRLDQLRFGRTFPVSFPRGSGYFRRSFIVSRSRTGRRAATHSSEN